MHNNLQQGGCFNTICQLFICGAISLFAGLNVYTYMWGQQDALEGDFSDVKHVIMQLTHGLSEVNRKHERLQGQMERLSAALPAVSAAAGRAKDALEPSRRTMYNALDVRDYDRQMADYALESAGARVVDTGDTIEHVIYESPVNWVLHMISAALCRECPGAVTIIRPGTLPGECWAIKGSRGEATIRLLGTVHVTGVSLEHIAPHIAPTREISSAPRLFQLEGLEYRGDPYPHDFGTFEYDKNGKPIQYFDILQPSQKGFNLVRLKIHSNWGHSVYTCLYRIRVHGEIATLTHRNPKDETISA